MSKKKDDVTVRVEGAILTASDITSKYTDATARYHEILSGVSSTVRGRPYDTLYNELRDLLDKNIECGALIDWDIKVKDTKLARKMYKEFMVKDGWLYAKK